jgi:hypothetical protein
MIPEDIHRKVQKRQAQRISQGTNTSFSAMVTELLAEGLKH